MCVYLCFYMFVCASAGWCLQFPEALNAPEHRAAMKVRCEPPRNDAWKRTWGLCKSYKLS